MSSITSQKKQLSMLESIGMEERQVRNMLFGESFFLVLPNILITLLLGTTVGFGIITLMKKSASYLEYQFPLLAIVFYCIGMIGIPMILSLLPLVERIKRF